MRDTAPSWLEEILESNRRFQQGIRRETHPVARAPCPHAVITCMDPRVNLEALGVASFAAAGAARSQVRVIRTIGAMSESRSLV
ncbi:MAG: hypothetical protein OEM59_11065, partial [Rhodospirillales bacterium]|nr:hypothetical protein [Rhodospirillales bacterium]